MVPAMSAPPPEVHTVNKNLVALACFAWAGAAISFATPASATVLTTQVGSYAACGGSYSSTFTTDCYGTEYYYIQIINFSSTNCGAGGCASTSGVVYTDIVYSTGRKTTFDDGPCGTSKVYGLGSCAC
jgi:hypothetical protein